MCYTNKIIIIYTHLYDVTINVILCAINNTCAIISCDTHCYNIILYYSRITIY